VETERRSSWPPTFPFTIGLYLCATLWLQRTGVARLESFVVDLLGSWLLISAVSALGWLVASRFTADPARRALVALIFGLWSVLYGSYFVFAAIAFGAEWRVLAIWTALFAMLVMLILKSRGELGRVSRLLNTAGFVLVAMVVPSIIRAVPSAPAPSPWTEARVSNALPDVFIIVPDKYSGTEFLAREYGIDHAATEDSLRALGFTIPRNARANYAHTRLALTTFLEGAYVLTPEDSANTVDYDALPARAQASPLWTELASKGYRVVFFPTTFGPTSDAVGVHLKLTADRPADAQFAGTWIFHSPIGSVEATVCRFIECSLTPPVPFAREPIAANEWKLRTLATLPDSGGPIAAFIHLMAPHEPFLYADDCTVGDGWTYTPEQENRNMDRLRRGYAAQIRCLDKLLLATVTEIIARSPAHRPPVIVIQSDHGRGRVTNDVLHSAAAGGSDTLTAQLAERFTLFAAYRFPGADTLMHDGITPVNVIPTLRHVLWGAPLVRHPDRSFSSPYTRELDLTELTPARLRALVPR
jgi:hypothetical protein